MCRRLASCLCFVLLAGGAWSLLEARDTSPPLVAVTDPAPCARLLVSPTSVRGPAFDPESGIAAMQLSLVRDDFGVDAQGWQTWNGSSWVAITNLDDRLYLAVNLAVQEGGWVSVDRLPSVDEGTLRYGERIHIIVRATNGDGLEAHWISCFMVVELESELAPSTPSW